MTRRLPEILVVDDTPANLILVRELLGPRGYRVRLFRSPEAALTSAVARMPDLVLLDVVMPALDGYEWCRRFKAQEGARDTPVIFVSALGQATDKLKAFDAGGVDFVTKPFDFTELQARLDIHLKLAQLKREQQARSERLEDALARLGALKRSREAMSRAIVHDLKNPAAAILMDATFLQGCDIPTAEAREAVEDLLGCAQRMLNMLDDILTVARAEDDKLVLARGPTDVGALVREAVQACVRATGADDREISLDLGPGLQRFDLDAALMRRVIENLVGNALKYSEGGRVELAASITTDGSLSLSVTDAGPGIPESQREDIFAPFVRLSRDEVRPERTGSGLGLSFCRLAVEAHSGSISCDVASGGGAIFQLTIPPGVVAQPSESHG